MHRHIPDCCRRSNRVLVWANFAAQGIAAVSCTAGGIITESIILFAAAMHHTASIAFRLMISEAQGTYGRSRSGDAMLAMMQIILWTSCLLLALYVTAAGSHGVFHPARLDVVALAGFATPGLLAAATTAALESKLIGADFPCRKADAFLSVAPTAFALGITFANIGAAAGQLDAFIGVILVLLLCTRVLIHLGQTLE